MKQIREDRNMEESVRQAAEAFDLPGGKIQAEPFGNGHINRTYKVCPEGSGRRYILQRINQYVFHHPDQVQENILAVTSHLREKIRQEGGDPERETLRVMMTRDGKPYYLDGEGGWWRMFPFVEGTFSRDLPDSPEIFEECGEVFGRFQRRLNDFPAEKLHETIPDFHNTPWRVRRLEEAARKDSEGRLKDVRQELDFCLRQAEWAGFLTEGQRTGRLPLRVAHNDTKLNNVLLDRETGKALCVVDLDTVMPGLVACDYGEAIRTGACTAPEDERDPDRIQLSMPMVRAYTRGFLRELREELTPEEIRSLPWGSRTMTLENGIRFLTDHLEGDQYFAIHRPGHNLDRARAQLTLLRRMEEKWDEMLSVLE